MEKISNTAAINLLYFPFLFTKREKKKLFNLIDAYNTNPSIKKSYEIREYLASKLSEKGMITWSKYVDSLTGVATIFEGLTNIINSIGNVDACKIDTTFYDFINECKGSIIPEDEANYLLTVGRKYFLTLRNWDEFRNIINQNLLRNLDRHININAKYFDSFDQFGCYPLIPLINESRKALKEKCKRDWEELLADLEKKGLLINAQELKEELENNFERNYFLSNFWGNFYLKIVANHFSSKIVTNTMYEIRFDYFESGISQSISCLNALKRVVATRKDLQKVSKLYELVDSFRELYTIDKKTSDTFDELKKGPVNPVKLIEIASSYLNQVKDETAQKDIFIKSSPSGVNNDIDGINIAIEVYGLFVKSARKIAVKPFINKAQEELIDDRKNGICFNRERRWARSFLNIYINGKITFDELKKRYPTFLDFLANDSLILNCPFLLTKKERKRIDTILDCSENNVDGEGIMLDIFVQALNRICLNPLYEKYYFTQPKNENDSPNVLVILEKLTSSYMTFTSFLIKYVDVNCSVQLLRLLDSRGNIAVLPKTFIQAFYNMVSSQFLSKYKDLCKDEKFRGILDCINNGDVFALEEFSNYMDMYVNSFLTKALITEINKFMCVVHPASKIRIPETLLSPHTLSETKKSLLVFCKANEYNEITGKLMAEPEDDDYANKASLLIDCFKNVSKKAIEPQFSVLRSAVAQLRCEGFITEKEHDDYLNRYESYLYGMIPFEKGILPMLAELKRKFNCPIIDSITTSEAFDINVQTLSTQLIKEKKRLYCNKNNYFRLIETLSDDPIETEKLKAIVSRLALNGELSDDLQMIPNAIGCAIPGATPYSIENLASSYNITGENKTLLFNYKFESLDTLLNSLKSLKPEVKKEVDSLITALAFGKNRFDFVNAFIRLEKKLCMYFLDDKAYAANRLFVGRHEKFGLEKYLNYVVNIFTLENYHTTYRQNFEYANKIIRSYITSAESMVELSSKKLIDFAQGLVQLHAYSSTSESIEPAYYTQIKEYLELVYSKIPYNLELDAYPEHFESFYIESELDTVKNGNIIELQSRITALLRYKTGDVSVSVKKEEMINELIALFNKYSSFSGIHLAIVMAMFEASKKSMLTANTAQDVDKLESVFGNLKEDLIKTNEKHLTLTTDEKKA